jgi:hypothetical protein
MADVLTKTEFSVYCSAWEKYDPLVAKGEAGSEPAEKTLKSSESDTQVLEMTRSE